MPATKGKTRILLVDDDPNIVQLVRLYLEKEGYEVETADRGDTAVEMFRKNPPHLMLLDIMLPGMDGWAVCREIRRTSNIPIIMLSAKGETFDRVLGLELGADDYITKPFAAEELVARMESVLRRTGRGGRELRAFDVVLDTQERTARKNGGVIELRPREFDLLELLMRNRGAALYRDVMYERVWGGEPDSESLRTVDTHIARLRKKLGWADRIETVTKIGYRLKKE